MEPKPKKNCRLKPSQALPIVKNKKFVGTYNELSVVVTDPEDMRNLISMGYFGKCNLSRSYPNFKRWTPEILRERVFQRRKAIGEGVKSAAEKVVVVPDSDSDDNGEYFVNLKPRYEIDRSGIKETLWLSPEEAFFLAHALGCLDIYYNDKRLDFSEIWEIFKSSDKYFVENYAVYYHFRAKNWVVKPGIKFGGDFLLYKQGPPFFHASYVVIISVVDENFKIKQSGRRLMKIVDLMGLNRLCETAGKELLICQVIYPRDSTAITYDDISKFKIREIVMRRWLPSQERHSLEDS